MVVTFQDLSTGTPTTWSWDFGNGNTSNQQNPTATFTTPGVYTVKLTVTNDNGNNTKTVTSYITVHAPPVVDFNAPVRTGCAPLRAQFTDLSTAGSGTLTTWEWDFGDGALSTTQSPSYAYKNDGTFGVTLKVTNSNGCVKTVSKPAYIAVTPGVNPVFTNTQPIVCRQPATINFSNISTGPGTLTYQWLFGDNTTTTVANPSHVYNQNGDFTVQLVVRSSDGCFDTLTKPNLIKIGKNVTSFDVPSNICVGSSVAFQNTSSPTPLASSWNFSYGMAPSTSNELNPTHTFNSTGTFRVKLYNTFAECIDSTDKVVTVNPKPTVDFNGTNLIACKPSLTSNFVDASVTGTQWLWDFGDGGTSTGQNPSHTYTTGGNFNVTLTATNAFGCSASVTKNQFVKITPPVAAANVPREGCVPFTITPTPAPVSVEPIASYFWDFGDGFTSTAQNPGPHTYTAQGLYTLKFSVTTTGGCTNEVTYDIKVGTVPTVDFTAVPTTVCAFQNVTFTSITSVSDEWLWTFGDATTSIDKNTTHQYEDTGRFTVSLRAKNNGCAVTVTKNLHITVLAPISKYSYAVDCNNQRSVQFTNEAVQAVSYLWDFGDGNTSIAPNPNHIYATLGTYNVSLTVTNGGCSHTIQKTVKLNADVADFTADKPEACKRIDRILFQSTGSNPANVKDYLWDLGDGVFRKYGASVGNGYPAAGTYTIGLRIVDINGCVHTTVKPNFLKIYGPAANFSSVTPGACINGPVTFTDLTATDGVHPVVSWDWSYGDGSSQTYTAPPFQHSYADTGLYSVRLFVKDSYGCIDSIRKSNGALITKPIPNFNVDVQTACPGALLQFTDFSIGKIKGYSWDFGDGNTNNTKNPVYSYAAPGLYSVKMRITDTAGCVDSITKTDLVRITYPISDFFLNDSTTICPPLEAKFQYNALYMQDFYWEFGDGSTSTLRDPSHFYAAYGNYDAKLIVIGRGGCRDTMTKQIQVIDATGLNFTYDPLLACDSLTVNFQAINPGHVEFEWDFNDGATLISPVPMLTHKYVKPGFFVPKLIVRDETGCEVPLVGTDIIKILNVATSFSLDKTLFCDSGTVAFSDSSKTQDVAMTYLWDFGDGFTSTDKDPTHFFTSPGVYTVKLTATTSSNCSSTKTAVDTIKVIASPTIDITANPDAICLGKQILYTGQLLLPDTSTITWSWNFGNNLTSNVQNPSAIRYNTAGDYVVTLVGTNSTGCKDTVIKNITVFAPPTITMGPDPTIQVGQSITIPVTYSAGVTSYTWTPATNLNCTNCATPVANPIKKTTYQVVARDNNNCEATEDITITVLCDKNNVFIPNTFTPNNDGRNDTFYPMGIGLDRINSMRIFNRWGEIIFEKKNFPAGPTGGWDGFYKGKPADTDAYVYVIEIVCGNGVPLTFKGTITLIR